ncbi:MAG: aldo/keto reductase [Oscillospiraceae bacterium]|nr:aldo/keto reductase [Oscillospiraceae bacterium]
MNYRINPKNGDRLSLLAFGCMRLPKDFAVTEKIIKTAIDEGVNYFDTAYFYPGSENALGRVLENNYLRDKVFIATKCPTFFIKKTSDFDKYFKIQLERLRTNRIDYYLMHMLNGPENWQKLVDLGALEWIESKKKSGEIKNLGFSFHGGAENFRKLIDANDWDFTLIMYNYYDVNNQAGRDGLYYAAEKGVPVMVMEPLRGGKLADLPIKAKNMFAAELPAHTPVEWAFRWIYSHNEVLTVLSGMNSMEMVKNNIKTASDADSYKLTNRENELIASARELIMAKTKIPCTGCNYCMPCKHKVDIALCFACYNDIAIEGKTKAFFDYTYRTRGHRASFCVGCGECEARCSQGIEIRKNLKEVKKKLEGGLLKPVGGLIRAYLGENRED